MFAAILNLLSGSTHADLSRSDVPFPTRPIPFLLRFVRLRPGMHLGFLSLVVIAAACAVAVQYGMKLLVDGMAGGPAAREEVWNALALFIGLIAAENILWRLSGWMGCRTIVAAGVDIRVHVFDHLSGHSQRFFGQHLTGALGSRLTGLAGAFGAVTSTLSWSVAPPITDFIGAMVIFSTVDWRMAVALAVVVAFLAVGLILFAVRGRPLHRQYAEQGAYVNGELVDTVSNSWTVKIFSARARERARLGAKFGVEADAQRKSWMYVEKTRVLHDIFLTLMSGAMLTWAVYEWTRGTISPGDVVVVSALTFRILHGSRDLTLALAGLTEHFGFITDTLQVIGQPHEVADKVSARVIADARGGIEFQNVSFGYADGRRVFDNLSLKIPAGQRVGIVGPSGAGKSTLINLVQRFADVNEGRILLDGQDIAQITQDSLRAKIATVPQEVSLFHRPVIENIRYGRPDATDEEVMDTARATYCDDFIRELPHGYDTLVGERGANLSGGQRQRLAIARAILKDAPVVILDEATSALDTESELAIQRAFTELVRGRTVLAVAHRLSTVASFDRIIVLVQGRVVEDGHPAELRQRHGVFDKMWRMQAEGLDVDDALLATPLPGDRDLREPAAPNRERA
ncbi:MAG: ABC transporter ATP-binding protein [Gammaproteobacteria bacterium]|nr:ABC transporter ATP-binding protein [Gammaproteobacteria bacterium]